MAQPPRALPQRAMAALQAGDLAAARRLYASLLADRPDLAECWHHLGLIRQRQADQAATGRMIRRAILCDPNIAEAHNNLAAWFSEQRDDLAAAVCARKALILRPSYAQALNNIGKSLKQMGREAEAVIHYRHVLRLDPSSIATLCNLGAAFDDLDRIDEALDCFHRALVIEPRYAIALNNAATSRQRLRELDRAILHARRAIRLEPHYGTAHANLGMALLLAGEEQEGWAEYEWWRHTGTWPNAPIGSAQKRWRGEDLAGRTLLLYAEQGLGDTLQFARYAASFAAFGARVLLQVQPPLKILLASVPGVSEVFALGETAPPADFHLPLISAPLALRHRPAAIPAACPYLQADPRLVSHWQERLGAPKAISIGLVWAGNARQHDVDSYRVDRRRSMRLESLAPLLTRPDVQFVSLQKGQAAGELDYLPDSIRPLDVMAEIEDFSDSAALVAQLDLVITVDTSVAHLAGALGKPVWILSRYDGCWRWGLTGEGSKYYPSARLFRQTSPGDWGGVVARIAGSLDGFISSRAR